MEGRDVCSMTWRNKHNPKFKMNDLNYLSNDLLLESRYECLPLAEKLGESIRFIRRAIETTNNMVHPSEDLAVAAGQAHAAVLTLEGIKSKVDEILGKLNTWRLEAAIEIEKEANL